ncbi:F-BAR domain only protein 1-like [Catharus ustulatus]|uniref:F-BAR domain only protein 1-like n=1 Tax=Catharus ustulatus TaxID=91951 RepID=UPI001C5B7B1D|nr:F-BAR domain only protein 1-like [Catharus ustulatus]
MESQSRDPPSTKEFSWPQPNSSSNSLTLPAELDNPGCSSSDSDYDEEEPRKFRVLIKPLQPQEPAQATEEQLRATVGHLSLGPALGGTGRRLAGRQVTSLTPSDPEGTLPGGDSGGRGLPAAQLDSGPVKPPQDPQDPRDPRDPPDSAALFGPPLESAFEEFPAPRSCSSPSSSSSSSSCSPENVPDSGLDSPSHPQPGPSPDSRPWTPQGDPKNSSRPWTPQPDPPNPSRKPPDPSWTPQGDPKNPSRPWTPQGDPPDPPNFAPFGAAEGLWVVPGGVSGVSGVAPPRSRSRCPTDPPPSPSPDPFGDPPVWGEPPPAPSSRSSSSSSPAPPSGRGSCSPSPSPWGCPGPGSGEGGAAGEAQPEPEPPWPSAAPRDVPVVAPPRRCRSRRAGPGSNSDLSRSLSPSPSWSCGPSHSAPASLSERGFFSAAPPALGLSRGPSPVVLGSQDALPVATAFTEYVHAYFKGRDADSCLVKVTGELTMSFPAGIVRVFGASAAPPVLSFRLLNAAGIEQFLPNSELLYSDPSQSDPSTKDFWLNMGALSAQLQRQAEQSPGAPYYNVVLLKYQFSRLGPGSAPLRLAVSWDCSPGCTRVTVEYGYNGAALALPAPLANVTVLLPLEEPLGNLRLQPAATWNLEEKRLLWKLLDVPGAPGQAGSGRLSASWEPLGGRSKPSPVAAQFSGEGSTLSGLELQLPGAAYRVSLLKKRFATGIYLAGS